MSTRISREAVRQRYAGLREIWPSGDDWHLHLRKRYEKILSRSSLLSSARPRCVLNLGSAGSDYGVEGDPHVFVDLASSHLPQNGRSVVADIHQLPFRNGVAQLIFAIGSVLNYCSAIEFFQQIDSVCAPGGYVLFDFEQAAAFEHLGHPERKSDVFFGSAIYDGTNEDLWYYSVRMIKHILNETHFSLELIFYIHVLSSFVYGLTKSERLAVKFAYFDAIGSKLPFLRNGASTVMILAQKGL